MSTEYETALAEFVRNELLHGRKVALTNDADLLGAGIVDSLGILRLVAFIEDRFGVKVPDEDVVFENFQSIGAMAGYVSQRQAAKV
ncbi:MAG: acyl carrier protein [Vicinamibacterales bacterium]